MSKTSEELIQEAVDKYIDKYCTKHGYSKEEAKHHIAVKLAEEYYRENPTKEDQPMARTELDIGCKGGC